MFTFLIGKGGYGITSATYQPDVPLLEQQEVVYQTFCENICKKLQQTTGNAEAYDIVDEKNLLILWENAPAIREIELSPEELLTNFISVLPVDETNLLPLYVDSPLTLAGKSGSALSILSRMTAISKNTGMIPIFLEDDFITRHTPKELETETVKMKERLERSSKSASVQQEILESISSAMAISHINRKDINFYKNLFALIEGLTALTGESLPLNYHEPAFITQYFRWQIEDITAKVCAESLNNIGTTSFYNYAKGFEQNPYYQEYLKIYSLKQMQLQKEALKEREKTQDDKISLPPLLEETTKKGNVPDPIDFIWFYQECEKHSVKDAIFKTRKKFALSAIDIPRVKLTCEKKIAVLKKKGLYKDALAKHSLTEL